MRQHLRWLPFPSATVAAIAFFLPWFAVSCKSLLSQQKHKIAFSGYNFASGNMPPVIEGMLQVQQKLAGFGNLVMSLFQKKAKTKPIPQKDPITVLRQGFPSYWWAFACFCIAALLGLWFAIRGPTLWLRCAGTLAVVGGIFCLLYPALNQPMQIKMPKQNLKILSVQLEYGGFLLLSGLTASLIGFWIAPTPKHLPTLPKDED